MKKYIIIFLIFIAVMIVGVSFVVYKLAVVGLDFFQNQDVGIVVDKISEVKTDAVGTVTEMIDTNLNTATEATETLQENIGKKIIPEKVIPIEL